MRDSAIQAEIRVETFVPAAKATSSPGSRTPNDILRIALPPRPTSPRA